VRSTKGDFAAQLPVTDDPAEVGPVDVVLFTVKSHQTRAAAASLRPLLHDTTAVLSLPNGLGNEETIGAVIGNHHVLGGVTYLLSTIAEPGLIAHTAGPATVIFGELDGKPSDRALRLVGAFLDAGVDATLSDDVRTAIWDKFAFICALSGMTAAVRLPIGDIRDVTESWNLFRELLREVASVAAAEGTVLGDDTVERHENFARTLERGTFSSLHFDLVHGKPMELDALHGELVRRARRAQVPVPVAQTIHGVLRPWAVLNDPRPGAPMTA
jgi:2-dehydropantoate 2-reductase